MARMLIPLAALALGAAPLVQAQSLDRAALERWLDGYEMAWESRDPDAAARLFAPNASYFETPYAEPFEGRDGIRAYWERVTADQRDVDFTSDVVAVDGDVGVAQWTATFTAASSGAKIELNGVFVLEFTATGLVSELREWWVLRP